MHFRSLAVLRIPQIEEDAEENIRIQNQISEMEEMESIGDEWTPEQVEDVYGDSSLEEALADRKASLDKLFEIIGKVINRD